MRHIIAMLTDALSHVHPADLAAFAEDKLAGLGVQIVVAYLTGGGG